MGKRNAYSMKFKKEVIAFIERPGNSAYSAKKYFDARDGRTYDQAMFFKWSKNAQMIKERGATQHRLPGAGRKPALADLENILVDEIIELRIQKMKVTRSWIADRGRSLAKEADVELVGSTTWVTNFMKRHGFSLRRTTNLTTLTDEQLLSANERNSSTSAKLF